MCKIGDIYMASLGTNEEGCLQSGTRPVIIVSNDMANDFSPVITVIPVTSRLNKKRLPTHVYLNRCGLDRPSVALAEQIRSINKSKLIHKIGSIKNTTYEEQLKNAIVVQLSI